MYSNIALETGAPITQAESSTHQVTRPLRNVAPYLDLLRVKRVDVVLLHQHAGQHDVFEALYAPRAARLVIVLKGLKHCMAHEKDAHHTYGTAYVKVARSI